MPRVLFADISRNESHDLFLRIDIFKLSKDISSFEHDCELKFSGVIKDMTMALSRILESDEVDVAFVDSKGYSISLFDYMSDEARKKVCDIPNYFRYRDKVYDSLKYPYTEVYCLQRITLNGANILDGDSY